MNATLKSYFVIKLLFIYFYQQRFSEDTYRYTVTQIFDYKHVLQDLNLDDFIYSPPDCTCTCSPFIYNPNGHVKLVILTVSTTNNTSFWDVSVTRPKYCEPKSINQTHHFKMHMQFVEEYARHRTKCDKEDIYTAQRVILEACFFSGKIEIATLNSAKPLFQLDHGWYFLF